MNYIYEVEKDILNFIESKHNSKIRLLIEGLPIEKKRVVMLSAISEKQDAGLKKMVKEIESEGIIYQLDKIIERIRKYNPVGDIEKKSFGEIFTPFSLINEMLDTLPTEVWSNPNLRWGDFCNGVGNFMVVIVRRLMIGLQEWESNENKRYKHIIEKMIYVAELQVKNMFLWMVSIDPKSKLKLNLYRGSSLSTEFDEHMREVWKVEKMDIIVSNPPYNQEISASGTSKDLFDQFILKYVDISDNTLMVTPSKWFYKSDKLDVRKKLILENRLQIIKTCDVFKELAIRGGISYFLSNANNKLVKFDNKIINLKDQLNILDFILLDQSKYEIILSLLNKLDKENIKISSLFNSKGYFGLKTNHSELCNSGIKCYYSGRRKNTLNLLFDNIKSKYYSFVDLSKIKDSKNKLNKWKVILSCAYGFITKSENTYNQIGESFISIPGECCTETYVFFDFNTEKECNNFTKILNSKLSKFLISIKKNKQDVTSKTFDLIPLLSLDKEWSDDDIYTHFNLSQEEIDLLNNNIIIIE